MFQRHCLSEIEQLRQIVLTSVREKDEYSMNFGLNRLSLLYLNEFLLYSKEIDETLLTTDKDKIRGKMSSMMDDWRWLIEVRGEN